MTAAEARHRDWVGQAVAPSLFGDTRFATLLGRRAWLRLPEAIRRRFGRRLRAGESLVYRGNILETRMSQLGRCLAFLLQPFGAPLPLEAGAGGAPAVVTVTENTDGRGQFWTRQYNRRNAFPQIVHSMKRFSGPTGLEEEIGHGIGMTLKLEAGPAHLLFHSQAYFVTLLGRRLYLPPVFQPGRLVVGHHDRGAGVFDFTLDLTHPVFGELLHQRARFCDMETWS